MYAAQCICAVRAVLSRTRPPALSLSLGVHIQMDQWNITIKTIVPKSFKYMQASPVYFLSLCPTSANGAGYLQLFHSFSLLSLCVFVYPNGFCAYIEAILKISSNCHGSRLGEETFSEQSLHKSICCFKLLPRAFSLPLHFTVAVALHSQYPHLAELSAYKNLLFCNQNAIILSQTQ